jgi:hypothetical protein
MRHLTALMLVAALFASPLRAQTQDEPVFASYEEMRATLDNLMSKRQIADLLTAFGGGDEMTPQDMAVLETQVRNLFPADFENSALMMRQEMDIYARVLWHQRPGGEVVSINMTFNSDPDVLIPLF